jgi:hypothetical protein
MYDERMLHFISKLTVIHLDPEASDPIKIAELPDDERSEGEERPNWYPDTAGHGSWHGLYKDVGIFTEHEWNLLMCKCLASMGRHHYKVYKEVMVDINLHLRNSTCRWWIIDYRPVSR